MKKLQQHLILLIYRKTCASQSPLCLGPKRSAAKSSAMSSKLLVVNLIISLRNVWLSAFMFVVCEGEGDVKSFPKDHALRNVHVQRETNFQFRLTTGGKNNKIQQTFYYLTCENSSATKFKKYFFFLQRGWAYKWWVVSMATMSNTALTSEELMVIKISRNVCFLSRLICT